jgi:4-cresol dehydrogenase (hydroxylating)
MALVLPPGVTEKTFQRALDAFAGVVGKEWVLATDEDRETYLDAEPPTQWKSAMARTPPLGDHPGFLTSWLLTA